MNTSAWDGNKLLESTSLLAAIGVGYGWLIWMWVQPPFDQKELIRAGGVKQGLTECQAIGKDGSFRPQFGKGKSAWRPIGGGRGA